jgi:exopolysaccharide biosynthesis polyprenyl glycosylphosphotransferase
MRKLDLAFNLVRVPLDFGLLMAAAYSAYFLRISDLMRDIRPVLFDLSPGYFFTLSVSISAILVFIFALSGLYLVHRKTPILQEIAKIGIAVSAGMALTIVYMFFNLVWFDSRFILLAFWLFAIVYTAAGRLALRGFRNRLLRKKGLGAENLLVFGKSDVAGKIKQQVVTNKKLGFNLVGHSNDYNKEIIRNLHKEYSLHRVIAADANTDRQDLIGIASFCEENGIQFSYITDTFGAILADMSFDILEGMPVVSIKPSPLDGWGKITKRGVDIAGASIMLIILSPLFLATALAIKRDSKGPVFVKLKRISNGREIWIYKFRSMVENAEKMKPSLMKFNERRDGPMFKMTNDPRVTRIGKFLRAKRIDELPQLINVLKGEISLVGPRPHEPEEIAMYEDHHKKVLSIKSGITGLAQVSGASDLLFDEEVKLDRFYIENWSMKKDIAILLRTLKIFLFDKSGV